MIDVNGRLGGGQLITSIPIREPFLTQFVRLAVAQW